MINKFICWVWGHIIDHESWTGKYGMAYHPFIEGLTKVPVMFTVKNDYCPRCGKKI